MAKAIHRVAYKLTDEDVATLRELASRWGGIAPLPEIHTIREALRRALSQERAKDSGHPQKKTRKSG
jgi:hypothetical protein